MIKCGKFTIPAGTSPFAVEGLGFQPQWAIFLFSNRDTEDVWAANPSMGMGWAALQNSVTDNSGVAASLRTSNVAEIWQGSGVGSTFVGNITTWVRATRGTDGWALVLDTFLSDGFNFHFSPGFSAGASGKIIYYLAGDDTYTEVAAQAPFVQSSPAYTLGWQPEAYFGLAHGGGVGAPGGLQNFGLVDQSVLGAFAGYYDEAGGSGMWSIWRGILDPNIDVQDWFGYAASGVVLEPTQSGGVWFSDSYSAIRTATTFDMSITPDAFGSGAARVQPFILGSVSAITGSFSPSATIGVPTEVALPFAPEAVVFFSPGESRSGAASAATEGATGFGFCTADDQAMLIYGGHWNPPTTFQSNGLISSSKCWVSNSVEDNVGVGNLVTAGSARCTSAGFEHTTLENSGESIQPVLYWALGPKDETPGFFRIL